MKLDIKFRVALRIILSLIFLYGAVHSAEDNIGNILFKDIDAKLVGHIVGFGLMLWFIVPMFLNGLYEIKINSIKYKTYFANLIFSLILIYILIEDFIKNEAFDIILFESLIILFLGYLTFYDIRFFHHKKKALAN